MRQGVRFFIGKGAEESSGESGPVNHEYDDVKDYNDAIYRIWLPHALLYGVPYELFWHLNPRKIKPWGDAYSLKRKEQDRNNWIIGRYFQLAIAEIIPKSHAKYPQYPFSDYRNEIHSEETRDYEMDAAKFWEWAKVANMEFEEQQKKKS